MIKPLFIISALLAILCLGNLNAGAGISPSQVLVLYNTDWTQDHPLTDKGQDSKEIAEHYVRCSTDAATGEKPHILGLSAKSGRSLGTEHLEEQSRDNRSGVILTHLTKMVGPTDKLRDSRLIEFTLPKNQSGWQLNTLNMQIGPVKSKLSQRLTLIRDGSNQFPDRILLQPSGDFTARINGRGFLKGSLLVNVSCQDKAGKLHRWEADYKDMADISISTTGPDNIRDDKNYLDLIETPIKRFLEDPGNARPDGTLLKDHILFFVICYGLPRTCIAPFGIERGITASIHNFGPIIDLGQRLQLMYYDFDAVLGVIPRPYRFDADEALTTFYFRSPQALPLYGIKANPFLHPEIYAKDRKPDSTAKPLDFSPANRKQHPDKHLYFAMRIDAPDAIQAKSLIDRAAYARQYGFPDMGVIPGQPVVQGDLTTGKLQYNTAGKVLWDQGYRRIFYHYTSSNRMELFRLPPDAGFYNKKPVYLPGGIAATVTSESGWNRKGSAFYKYFDQGVSVTLAAARVYEGAPHIHNKSWWDDSILYPALMQGKAMGEALLMNQTHLGWITSFIGDPLYRLPAETGKEKPPLPEIKSTRLVSLPDRPDHVAVAVQLTSDPLHPRVAQMKLETRDHNAYICPTFEPTPVVVMERKELDARDSWRIFLMDPFGREIQHKFMVCDLQTEISS